MKICWITCKLNFKYWHDFCVMSIDLTLPVGLNMVWVIYFPCFFIFMIIRTLHFMMSYLIFPPTLYFTHICIRIFCNHFNNFSVFAVVDLYSLATHLSLWYRKHFLCGLVRPISIGFPDLVKWFFGASVFHFNSFLKLCSGGADWTVARIFFGISLISCMCKISWLSPSMKNPLSCHYTT